MQFFFVFYTRVKLLRVEAIGGPAKQSTAGGACDDEEDDRIGKPGMSGFVEQNPPKKLLFLRLGIFFLFFYFFLPKNHLFANYIGVGIFCSCETITWSLYANLFLFAFWV